MSIAKDLEGRERVGSANRIGQTDPLTYEPMQAAGMVHLFVTPVLSSEDELSPLHFFVSPLLPYRALLH